MKPPTRGSIIKLNFNLQSPLRPGREQTDYQPRARPLLVISNSRVNTATGMLMVCPISSKAKGYGLEVMLPDGMQTSGVVLVNQVKAIDWRTRGFKLVEHAPQLVMDEVLEKVIALLED